MIFMMCFLSTDRKHIEEHLDALDRGEGEFNAHEQHRWI